MSSNSDLELRDAVASDLRDLAGGAVMTRQHGRAFHMQLGGEACTLTFRGDPVAAVGFWPADGFREVWLMATPALRRKSVLPGALELILEEMRRRHDPALPTVAAVAIGNRGGVAIATRLGFIDAGDHPLYPGCAMFVFAG